jgi:hypothetical protein
MSPDVFDPGSPSAPWWVRPLYFFGIPAGLCVFLVWFLTAIVVAGQAETQETLDAHTRDTQVQLQLLRAICFGVSETPAERAGCEVGR